uniref:Ras association (RalGDS/AF-6) and pleckstrin homology domains 1a n=1 Tax=Xiphophorus couchianus TaxID=32473 RepID=A0A3B5MF62_9TELE
MDQLSDEEVEVRGEEDEEEEDSDKEDQDLDKMFGAWLGELDKLTQSLDDGRPECPPQQKAPLRQETNMANFSYRFSIYNINEALNQGENVDLNALMADLSSIEQELSTINTKSSSSSSMARLGLTDTKVAIALIYRPIDPSIILGASSSSSSGRPPLASNFSLDDITAQLEKASLSMDEAARQTSSHSLSSASSYTSASVRRPGSSQRQHRRTGSVGTVSEHEVRSFVHSSRSSVTSASGISVNSASSMDSLDSVLRSESDDPQPSEGSGQHSYLDRETSLILRNIAGKPPHLLTKMDPISRPIPVQIPSLSPQSQTPPSRSSYTDGLIPSEDSSSSPSPPSPPPPPPLAVSSMGHQGAPPSSYVKYSTLARLQSQNQARTQQVAGAGTTPLPLQNYNTLPASYGTSPPSPPPPPPPVAPAPGSAMAALKFGLPSPNCLPPPPLPEEEALEPHSLPEGLDANGLPPPPPPEPLPNPCPQLSNSGLQQFLSQKFPNMVYDFTPSALQDGSPAPLPPPTELSPPASLQVLRPLSPNAPPPAPPKTFSGGFPPLTAPKPSGPSSLPIALSPVSPTQPFSGHCPVRKQQSFSTGHSPNQPPPTLPKQHSLSSKNLAISPSASSSSVSIAAATSSLVKQIVNQFPGNTSPIPPSSSAPQSPPAVKAKPKWQIGGAAVPQSPEFPPPPPDGSLGDFPPPPSSSSKSGSPIKKSPSTSSTGSAKRGPPPTPQRASSMKDPQDERPKKVESLLSKFGQAPQMGTSSSSSSATGSPSKDSASLPAPLPKPGKLNLANLPLVIQGLQSGQQHQSDFPSPPPPPPASQHPHLDSSADFFPPPPTESELFPPPPHPSEFHHPPKVAVVNPQPQMQPPASATSSFSSSSWKQGSLKKGAMPPPAMNRRSSNTSAAPASLAFKPHFLEDLNRTLKRKSVSRHGSLTSSHLIPSSKMEPVGTMDDMALLPPPPPELLPQQHQQGVRGHSHTLSRHHGRYATLRRGPPPAPPKRDQSTKLTSEW